MEWGNSSWQPQVSIWKIQVVFRDVDWENIRDGCEEHLDKLAYLQIPPL